MQEAWTDDARPAWATKVEPPRERGTRVNAALAAKVDAEWSAAAAAPSAPRLVLRPGYSPFPTRIWSLMSPPRPSAARCKAAIASSNA